MAKRPLRPFLEANPFPDPLTLGFFYREKMRAIHRISPDVSPPEILEIGGGEGGLTALLYPDAHVTNLDMEARFAESPSNLLPNVTFIAGDATALPFPDASFDAVTMFDLIEHVPDDQTAMREAWRVLRPGGCLLLSTPEIGWRYPYYRILAPLCPTEGELFERWGHVRRGYTLEGLEALVGHSCTRWGTFISPATALAHDFAFSNLPHRARRWICMGLSPLTWGAYALHRPHARGTELAVRWDKPS